MAETWLGRGMGPGGIDQRVCLKFIRREFSQHPDFLAAFSREAQIVAGLRHQNVVTLIGFDLSQGCLVLELVDGTDLRTLLESLPERRLSVELTVYIASELCKALRYTHSFMSAGKHAGIVHRDISASNVLLSYHGEVKLADFGVAHAITAVGGGDQFVAGKRPYMSPEQARGEKLDGRSDLFSVGVLCYEMLTGRRPFDRYGNDDPLDTRYRGAAGEYKPLRDIAPHIPADVEAVVEQLLEADPQRRFPDAETCARVLSAIAPETRTACCFELGRLLEATRPHETIVERTDATFSDVRPKLLRKAFVWIPLAAIAIAAILLSPLSAVLREPPPKPSALAMPGRSLPPLGVEESLINKGESSREVVEEAKPPRLSEAPVATLPGPRQEPVSKASGRAEISRGPGTAKLVIGSLPASAIWLDGTRVGESPLELSVPIGRHRIAAGGTKPEVTRTIDVLPNKQNSIIIELPP